MNDEPSSEIALAIGLRDALLAFADWYFELANTATSFRTKLLRADKESVLKTEVEGLLASKRHSELSVPSICKADFEYMSDVWQLYTSDTFWMRGVLERFYNLSNGFQELSISQGWATKLLNSLDEMNSPLSDILSDLSISSLQKGAVLEGDDTSFVKLLNKVIEGRFPQPDWEDQFSLVIDSINRLKKETNKAFTETGSSSNVDGPDGIY